MDPTKNFQLFRSPKKIPGRLAGMSISAGLGFLVGGYTPLGYQQLTDLAAAHALTVPAGATVAVFMPEGDVRWRDDGVDPTSSVGMLLVDGMPFPYDGSLSAFRVIAASGAAVLNVSYYKRQRADLGVP